MKKIIKGLFFVIFSIFIFNRDVNAETFTESTTSIQGEYITKMEGEIRHYLTVKFVYDEQGKIVYCIEPFVLFENNSPYKKLDKISDYNLTKEQLRKIELLAYYGYGYGDRMANKWYSITQYLIWRTADENADIYFTDTLIGNRISKYETEIAEILKDVENHDKKASFIQDYTVNLNDNLTIDNFSKEYEIMESSYEYSLTNTDLTIDSIKEDGYLLVKKKSDFYENTSVIFDSNESQDLIRPGNVENKIYKINISTTKGTIVMDIRDDKDVYSKESDFSNTCYEIIKNKVTISKVCTDKEIKYQTEYLPYGNYTVKQVSNGIGYLKDTRIYALTIKETNKSVPLTLHNYLIKGDINITKYYCKDDNCILEPDAKFNIYDKNNDLVDTLVTNEKGFSNYTLGFGKYDIEQVAGKEGYSKVDNFRIAIQNNGEKLEKTLYNNYIEPVKIPVEEPKEPEVEEKEPEIELVEPEEEIIKNSEDVKEEEKVIEKSPTKIEEEITFDQTENTNELEVEEVEEKEDTIEMEEIAEEIIPPDTGIKKNNYTYIIVGIIFAIKLLRR